MRSREIIFKALSMFDRTGLHLIPKHYYTPIPDCTWLKENRPLWDGRSSLKGIHWDLAEQFSWLEDTCAPYYSEVEGLKSYNSFGEGNSGPGYGSIESQVLHCFLRAHTPKRVIEIGSGVSTRCMLEAASLNLRDGKQVPEITCVEPYPSEKIRNNKDIKLVAQLCQAVPSALFENLSAGDLLFIDSSHAVKVGSDVMRIYLEIIPCLPPGIFLHIHDIYLPYAYPRNVFGRPFWWQETALLMALLINNPKLSVLTCLSALHYDYPTQLQNLLTDYHPAQNDEGLATVPQGSGDFPSSIWLQTV